MQTWSGWVEAWLCKAIIEIKGVHGVRQKERPAEGNQIGVQWRMSSAAAQRMQSNWIARRLSQMLPWNLTPQSGTEAAEVQAIPWVVFNSVEAYSVERKIHPEKGPEREPMES
jgi:hypothetical protein